MSGTTTGGGIPHDEVILTDPKSGKECRIAKSDVATIFSHLAEDDPLKSILREFLKDDAPRSGGGDPAEPKQD